MFGYLHCFALVIDIRKQNSEVVSAQPSGEEGEYVLGEEKNLRESDLWSGDGIGRCDVILS